MERKSSRVHIVFNPFKFEVTENRPHYVPERSHRQSTCDICDHPMTTCKVGHHPMCSNTRCRKGPSKAWIGACKNCEWTMRTLEDE